MVRDEYNKFVSSCPLISRRVPVCSCFSPCFLLGGEKATARRRFILSPSEGTDASDRFYLDRSELIKLHLKLFLHVHEQFMGTFIPTREEVGWMSEYSMLSGSMMNHWGLFLPTILSQASEEQMGYWLPLAATMKIVGAYGQTELGSSFLLSFVSLLLLLLSGTS
jgi:acyl-CoA oxidase